VRFSEEDYISQLTEEDKAKWHGLSHEEKAKAWLKIKKDFPFEIDSPESLGDEHHNWIEDWDKDVQEFEEEKWDYHQWVKEEIKNKINQKQSK
jgi:hypothetical protein